MEEQQPINSLETFLYCMLQELREIKAILEKGVDQNEVVRDERTSKRVRR